MQLGTTYSNLESNSCNARKSQTHAIIKRNNKTNNSVEFARKCDNVYRLKRSLQCIQASMLQHTCMWHCIALHCIASHRIASHNPLCFVLLLRAMGTNRTAYLPHLRRTSFFVTIFVNNHFHRQDPIHGCQQSTWFFS